MTRCLCFRYSERQLTHGLWLARWMELWQPFAGGQDAGMDEWPAGVAGMRRAFGKWERGGQQPAGTAAR